MLASRLPAFFYDKDETNTDKKKSTPGCKSHLWNERESGNAYVEKEIETHQFLANFFSVSLPSLQDFQTTVYKTQAPALLHCSRDTRLIRNGMHCCDSRTRGI